MYVTDSEVVLYGGCHSLAYAVVVCACVSVCNVGIVWLNA